MGRASKTEAVANRLRVVETAASLLRQKGPEGVAIDVLMSEAGLTRGGFYKMFGSKDALAEEACTLAFDGTEQSLSDVGKGEAATRLQRLIDFYFAAKPSGHECPMASLAGDAARAPVGGPFRRAFATGLRKLVTVVAGDKPSDHDLTVFAAMVGSLVLKRANEDKVLADQIEMAVLRFAGAQKTIQ